MENRRGPAYFMMALIWLMAIVGLTALMAYHLGGPEYQVSALLRAVFAGWCAFVTTNALFTCAMKFSFFPKESFTSLYVAFAATAIVTILALHAIFGIVYLALDVLSYWVAAMTEAGRFACNNPTRMLEFLQGFPRESHSWPLPS